MLLLPRTIDHLYLVDNWRVREASETPSGVYKFELVQYMCVYIYIFIPCYVTFYVRDWSKSVY